jgi:hypothetical protein
LIVGIEHIIGEQPPVPELPPRMRGRFQLVFRRFISVFAAGTSLALFLDDLQWLDAATLDLLEIVDPVGCAEPVVDWRLPRRSRPIHPLMRKLEAMR